MSDIVSLSGTFSSTDSDEDFFYVGGPQGIVVIRKSDQRELAFGTVSGVNDIWAGHPSFVYLATTSGIRTFIKSNSWDDTDLSSNIANFATPAELPAANVLSIDGNSSGLILAGTASGISLFDEKQQFDSTELSEVSSVKVTESGTLFYGGSFGLASRYTTVTGSGFVADYVLDGSTIPPVGEVLDIDVVTNNSQNTVALGTPNGVIIIKEEGIIENSTVLQLLR